jgi:hypothetical protein
LERQPADQVFVGARREVGPAVELAHIGFQQWDGTVTRGIRVSLGRWNMPLEVDAARFAFVNRGSS